MDDFDRRAQAWSRETSQREYERFASRMTWIGKWALKAGALWLVVQVLMLLARGLL